MKNSGNEGKDFARESSGLRAHRAPVRGVELTTPTIGEVWIANSTGNYFRVDVIINGKVMVTRLGYARGQDDYIVRKSVPDSSVWRVSTFKNKDLRRVARKAAKFEAFLSQYAVNA